MLQYCDLNDFQFTVSAHIDQIFYKVSHKLTQNVITVNTVVYKTICYSRAISMILS